MKNPYIIPSIIIAAAILGGFWMLKSLSEPQEVIVAQPPNIAIYDAAIDGNIEVVKQHLAAGTDVNDKGISGRTPLMQATRGGRMEVAELLIANGADLNAKSDDGLTPLHASAALGYTKIAELIIDKGADVNAKSVSGSTPLDLAMFAYDIKQPEVIADKKETADLLRKHGAKTGEELEAAGN